MIAFTVSNVLGEVRTVKALYAWTEDGVDHAAYDCPFCCSAVDTRRQMVACENPWCSANPRMPVAAALEMKEKAERKAREDAERKRNHEWAMERIREDNARRAREYQEWRDKVTEAKGCLSCSDQYRGKVRRHRAQCPKEARFAA